MAAVVANKRAPGSLAERFWSIAKSTGPAGDDTTNPDPRAVVRHVLRILDALESGEVGDGVSQSTVSFLQLLRQQEQQGDYSYASPEQARGESLDERSLVFSVGVLLFEELTGRHPFGAMASGRRFTRIQKGELGSGVQYFPQVPAELRNVLMKAMGPFPEERYRSLKELRAHLEAFVDGRPEVDDLPGMAKPVRRPLKGLVPTPADLAFAPIVHEQPTKVIQRKPTPRPAPVVEEPPSLKKPAPKYFAILERVAWVACGAAVALVVAYVGMRPKAPAAPPAAMGAPAPGAAAPVPTRTFEPPALATEPEPTVFDIELAGRNAAKAARECFGDERAARTVSFGVGLLFAKDEALSRRTYLSPDEPLSPDERRCVAHGLVGVSSGAAPGRNTIVELRLRLRPDGTNEVRAAVQK